MLWSDENTFCMQRQSKLWLYSTICLLCIMVAPFWRISTGHELRMLFVFYIFSKMALRWCGLFRLNQWWQMDYFDNVFHTFLGLDSQCSNYTVDFGGAHFFISFFFIMGGGVVRLRAPQKWTYNDLQRHITATSVCTTCFMQALYRINHYTGFTLLYFIDTNWSVKQQTAAHK